MLTNDITVETLVRFMVFHILISESLYGIKDVLKNTLSLRIRAKNLFVVFVVFIAINSQFFLVFIDKLKKR